MHWLRDLYIVTKVAQDSNENGSDGIKAGCGLAALMYIILPIVSYISAWYCYGKECTPPFGYIFSFLASIVIPLALLIVFTVLARCYMFLSELVSHSSHNIDEIKSIDKSEVRYWWRFSFKTNIFIAFAFISCLLLGYHNEHWETCLALVWALFAILWIMMIIYKMFTSFKAGEWGFMVSSFIFTAFPCFVVSAITADCRGSDGLISSPIHAILIFSVVMLISTLFAVWLKVKSD